MLRRGVKRPRCSPTDRAALVLLASRLRTWRQALLIVQPETLLHWHRDLFRCFRRQSRASTPAHRPPLAPETVALIREMAAANRTWGAERIKGALLRLDIRVAEWTIQKYMSDARQPRRGGQTWANFLANHGRDIWAADFFPVTDLLFRPLHAFSLIEIASRRVVHVAVTQHSTDAWVAQQLREATPFGRRPKHLILDNDSRYGPVFARLAEATGIDLVRTAYRAPRENAICERFLGSVRRECLDHLFVLGEAHVLRILKEYATYFNTAHTRGWISGSRTHPPPTVPSEDHCTPRRYWAISIASTLAPREHPRTK
jgi:transposase InsO family protein